MQTKYLQCNKQNMESFKPQSVLSPNESFRLQDVCEVYQLFLDALLDGSIVESSSLFRNQEKQLL